MRVAAWKGLKAFGVDQRFFGGATDARRSPNALPRLDPARARELLPGEESALQQGAAAHAASSRTEPPARGRRVVIFGGVACEFSLPDIRPYNDALRQPIRNLYSRTFSLPDIRP